VTQNNSRTYWRVFFLVAALEAGAAFVALAAIPTEGGISTLRLALYVLLLSFLALEIYCGLRPPAGLDSLARPAIIITSALLALTLGLILFFVRYLDPARLLPVYARLSPVLWYLLILGAQAAIFLLFIRNGLRLDGLETYKPVLLPALLIFGGLVLVLAFVSFTRLGLTPDPAYWGEPGVPLLGWQFALALLGGVTVFCISFNRRAARTLDSVLPAALWIIAVAIWLSVPVDVLKNSFYVAIDPPAYQPFPYSDAGYYDSMAHSLLIGHPYQGQVPTRPLYIVFLAVLHLLFGENYSLIIAGQTFVLALIPVVLYLLGAQLHSRAAGVTAALFAVFRELTTLWVSSETRVSNTKTLLVDLPTLLFLSVACLFALRWLERRNARSAFLAGGTFGIFLLLRTQSFLVLPFLFAVALLVYGFKKKRWVTAFVVFCLGLAVTVAPWLAHNYLRLGQFTFDAPFQYKVIASQYAYSGNLDIQNYDFEGKSLPRVLFDFALKDPSFVFGFIANHFLAGEVDGLLALPLIEPYHGIFEPVNLYWMGWDGRLPWYNLLLVLFYLAVIALGLGAAWRRWRWAGLLPLAFNIGYALATAIGRFSGWRYDLPADWVLYFYFGIGFIEWIGLTAWLFGIKQDAGRSFGEGAEESIENLPSFQATAFALNAGSLKPLLPLALLFAVIGGLPWLAEIPSSARYADRSAHILETRLIAISGETDPSAIDAFLSQPAALIVQGRLLYPRYFYRGVGMASANAWPAYAIRDYPRTGFMLLNESLVDVILPARDAQPLPHGADVILLGCRRDGYIEARLAAFPEANAAYKSDLLFEPCAPP
jgi:hypothetical protein